MTHKTQDAEPLDDQAADPAASREHNKKTAALYVVATPIGNLDDFTDRARNILQQVDLIAAEDTRHTGRLLDHYGIRARLVSLHDHNESGRATQLLSHLQAGASVALVSDAGTPLISDPGFHLVQAVREAGYPVVPVPGACALIAALSVSGLPTDRFFFAGFLPAKDQARRDQLQALQQQQGTLVFYESPHRILDSLKAMAEVLGKERRACLGREITKRFETFLSGRLDELLQQVLSDANQQKGEFVLLVEGFTGQSADQAWVEACRWLQELQQEMPPSRACALVARMTGVKKKALYQWMLEQEASGSA
ncbi:16S rRNA (cytidine(1402)-2'-O)-methyltransferase [Marinospirillum alkaliphilum]|nr:16S rRNA (cytidine(1402)-2'-O)-methyltransferase [Marinospirillum alkaliphilum]